MHLRLVIIVAAGLWVWGGCGDEGTPPTSDGAIVWPDLSYPDYTSGTCAPGSCSGCCQQGVCMPGSTNAACGFSGMTCQVCQGTQNCQMGVCTAPKCDATSCASGCCDSAGACQKGTEDTACGTGGQVCQSCTSSEICSNNQCGAKGPTMYKVTLVSAKVTTAAVLICGIYELSKCDLYVILEVGNGKAQSTFKDNTHTPVWNEFMLVATEADILNKFKVKVRDDDPIGWDAVSSCSPVITASDLQAGKHTSDCGSAKELTWSFQKI